MIIALGLVISACQSKGQGPKTQIEVVLPASLGHSPEFRAYLESENLFLRVVIETEGEALWSRVLPMDLGSEVEIPAFVFEAGEGEPRLVSIEIGEMNPDSTLTPLLKGSRQVLWKDFADTEQGPIKIYLLLTKPLLISEDPVSKPLFGPKTARISTLKFSDGPHLEECPEPCGL